MHVEKKVFGVVIFILALLISLVVSVLFVNCAVAQFSETITIKVDGSISPSTVSITKIGNVYTMTRNISASVTIQKSDSF